MCSNIVDVRHDNSLQLFAKYTSRGQKCLLVKQLKFTGQQGVQIMMIWRVEFLRFTAEVRTLT